MSWITPKTDWTAGTTIGSGDFNRIEGDILYLSNKAESDFTGVWDDFITPVNYTCNYSTEVFNDMTNVTMSFRTMVDATSNSVTFTDLNESVPVDIRPVTSNVFIPMIAIRAKVGGVPIDCPAYIKITTDGNIYLFRSDGENWPVNDHHGYFTFIVTYPI